MLVNQSVSHVHCVPRQDYDRLMGTMNMARGANSNLAGETQQAQAERDKYIRAFNRLEKAVTNHIKDRCIDSDDLAHVHKAILRDLTDATR